MEILGETDGLFFPVSSQTETGDVRVVSPRPTDTAHVAEMQTHVCGQQAGQPNWSNWEPPELLRSNAALLVTPVAPVLLDGENSHISLRDLITERLETVKATNRRLTSAVAARAGTLTGLPL